MPQLPRGVPFIDLLVPPGTSVQAGELQTRLDLVAGPGWRVLSDDGTFEESDVPAQPLRGNLERIWVVRMQPLVPGEDFQNVAGVGLEVCLMTQAKLCAVGVYGLYSWGLVAFEDARWLHGLLLLDWLYNPRIDAAGELIEDPDPTGDEALLAAKVAVFGRLWTLAGSRAFAQRLPPGALQQVETHQVLSLLGPGGSFDPRYWQSLAMQLVLPEVRALAQQAASGAAPGMAPAAAPAVPAAPKPAPKPAQPDDGLTPLARAQKEAAERARAAAEVGAAAEPVEEEAPDGPPVRWWATSVGPILWLPEERFDAGLLRSLRGGAPDALPRAERAAQPDFEAWLAAGGAFATEVPLLSRLFVDDKPLHKAGFEALASEHDGLLAAPCHLPRVDRVLAVLVPALGPRPRRILVTSAAELPAVELRDLAEGV